jgi:1,4-dihydroxy-2-naphthoate octaprenyltransferase
LSNKLGMAGYFYKFGSGEVVDRLRLLQQTHLLLCLLITIGLAGLYYYHKQKERIQTPILFLIGGFKIYIGIFYSFIQIPYQYLFTVPVFSTIIAILYLGNFCFTPTNTTSRN